MNTSCININGMSIEFTNNRLYINGEEVDITKHVRNKENLTKPVRIDKDGNINGDVNGNITITGNNVTINVSGDVMGNIAGNGDITIKGDLMGNVVGNRIR